MFKEMSIQFPKTPIRDRLRAFVLTPAREMFVIWLLVFAVMGSVLQFQSRQAHLRHHEYAMEAVESMRYRVMLGMRDLVKVQERYFQLVDLTSLKYNGFELVTVDHEGLEIHLGVPTAWGKIANGGD